MYLTVRLVYLALLNPSAVEKAKSASLFQANYPLFSPRAWPISSFICC